ncbi:MAG: pentapeptide repeat-containing protein [Chloroflexi bacterium]|nr:pentapeptide repeat-containing protein [Chloroflexota bacterium]
MADPPENCAYPGCTLPAEAGSHATMPASPPARPRGIPYHFSLKRQNEEGSFCVLHDPNPDKDVARFQQALDAKMAREEADAAVRMVNLAGVVFPGPMDWMGRTFPKAISFWGATFQGEARFVEANCLGEFRFEQANFLGEAYFHNSTFQGWTTFANAIFKKMFNIWNTTFKGEVSFLDAAFKDAVVFDDITFKEEVRFDRADFCQEALFFDVTFKGPLRFLRTGFNLSLESLALDFTNVTLEQPETASFEQVNLSRASFLRTDMSRVRLVGVAWGPPPRPGWRHPQFQRIVLHDERSLDLRHNSSSSAGTKEAYQEVELLYRQLRINLEREKQEVEAGSFYVGEMEMRRKNPGPILWGPSPFRWVNKALLNIYWVAASYGESFFRPLAIYLLLGAAFALVYLARGFNVPNVRDFYWLAPSEQGFVYDFLLALRNSLNPLAAFAADFRPLDWVGGLLRIFNSFSNVILLAAIGVAVRRRFKR